VVGFQKSRSVSLSWNLQRSADACLVLTVCDCYAVQSSTQQGTVPSRVQTEAAVSRESSSKVAEKSKLSLFDDEDDNMDLFAPSTSKTTKSAAAGDTSKVLLMFPFSGIASRQCT